jgi:U3 small nucleolar RNA-associated protein 14
LDIDRRQEINDQLARGESLRRKIQGVSESGDNSDDDSNEDDDGIHSDSSMMDAKQLKRLAELGEAGGVSDDASMKGVFAMKFMKVAQAREQEAVDREVNLLLKEFAVELDEEDNTAPHQSRKRVFLPVTS